MLLMMMISCSFCVRRMFCICFMRNSRVVFYMIRVKVLFTFLSLDKVIGNDVIGWCLSRRMFFVRLLCLKNHFLKSIWRQLSCEVTKRSVSMRVGWMISIPKTREMTSCRRVMMRSVIMRVSCRLGILLMMVMIVSLVVVMICMIVMDMRIMLMMSSRWGGIIGSSNRWVILQAVMFGVMIVFVRVIRCLWGLLVIVMIEGSVNIVGDVFPWRWLSCRLWLITWYLFHLRDEESNLRSDMCFSCDRTKWGSQDISLSCCHLEKLSLYISITH